MTQQKFYGKHVERGLEQTSASTSTRITELSCCYDAVKTERQRETDKTERE